MTRQRIDVKQAAQILNISTDAVHKRVRRGTLPSDKDPDGRVFVYLDNNLDEGYTRPDSGYTPNGQHGTEERTDDEPRYDLIAVLREQLAAEREANRENRRIIAGLIERVPALEAPQQSDQEPPQEPPNGAGGVDHGPELERRSWWRRVFGG